MMNIRKYTAVIALLLLTMGSVNAQPNFEFTVQSWGTLTSYDDGNGTPTTQLGVGVRRARLRAKMTRDKVTGFIQFDAATATMIDAQIDYEISDAAAIRMGRFVGPGSQAGGRTSHTTGFDFAERSIVGRLWGAAVARSDYRTYGIAFLGKTEKFNYEIMANNGGGSLNLTPYNTNSSKSGVSTGMLPQVDLMISTKLIKPLELGIHYGLPSEDRINTSALTGYAYLKPDDYIKGTYRGKVDFARLVKRGGSTDKTLGGFQILGFYKVREQIEVGFGYASWEPDNTMDNDAFGNLLFGVNYFADPEHWKDLQLKFTVTYKTTENDAGVADPLIFHFVTHIYLH